MSLSTATTSTFTISSITAALVITGLTLAAAGTTGNQPAQAGPPKLVATTSADTADTSNIKRAAIAVAASDASDDSKDGDTDTTAPVADPAPTSGYGGFGGGTGLPTPNGFGGGISSGLGRNRSTTASTRSRETHDAADGSAEAGVVDFKQYTASETKIVEALKSQTRLEFIETPLRDVVDFLKEQHDIEIQIDTRALDNMAMTPDEPITKSLRGLSLRSALRLTLRDLGLTYIIRDEVLTITTKDVADSTLDTRVYGLRTDYDPEPLVEMIRKHVSPQSWDESGGQGAISAAGGLLVISQTQQIHEEILEFLGQLEKAHVLGGE